MSTIKINISYPYTISMDLVGITQIVRNGEILFNSSPSKEPIVRKDKKSFVNFDSFARARRADYAYRHRNSWRDSILTEKRGIPESDPDLHIEKSNPDLNLRPILKKSRKSFQLGKERNIRKVHFKLGGRSDSFNQALSLFRSLEGCKSAANSKTQHWFCPRCDLRSQVKISNTYF